jgi:hypothetical protein
MPRLLNRNPAYRLHRPTGQAACRSILVEASGYIERQGQVIHVMVKQMRDLSGLLTDCPARSRDFR